MTPVRLEPAALRSRVKHSTTEPLHSLNYNHEISIKLLFMYNSLNVSFGCSKEPSHRDGSFEYPQHILLLRYKKINLY